MNSLVNINLIWFTFTFLYFISHIFNFSYMK